MTKDYNEQIDRVLNSSRGMKKTEAPAFFYTRLRARMEKANGEKAYLIRKPALAIAACSLFLLLNILTILKTDKQKGGTESEKTGIENFAGSYSLGDTWNN